MLLGTESLYHSFPSYAGPGERRRLVVVLTFRRAPADGEDAPAAAADEEEGGGEGEDEGGEQRRNTDKKSKDVTVMTVQTSRKDSIDSLNRRIRVRV